MTSSASSDPELLAAWLDRRHEPAFRMLVGRYAGLVRASALRTCENESLAAEAAQLTFITLARKARSLTSCRSLGGWLHQTAVWHARNLLRKARRESRKRDHFQAAMDTNPSHTDAWQNLAPALDDALGSLSAADREALLLRFYRALSISEVAAVLGIAAEAARKRIDRALERLRGKLARRGVALGVSLGTVMLAGFANDAQAASGMVPALTTKALAAGAGGAAAVPMSLTAKAACVALPASVMFGGALWLAAQQVFLADLNRQCDALEERLLALPKIAAAPHVSTRQPGFPKDKSGMIDWKAVAERLRLADDGDEYRSDLHNSWQVLLSAMTPDDLAAAMDEIARTDLTPEARQRLEYLMIEPLLLKAPGQIFARFGDRGMDECGWIINTNALTKWANTEPAAATAWLDSQIAANRFPGPTLRVQGRERYKLEADLIAALCINLPAVAKARIAALTPVERGEVLRLSHHAEGGEAAQPALADLARESLSGRQLDYVISFPVIHLIVDGYGLDKATGYIERIHATPSEREACARVAADYYVVEFQQRRPPGPADFKRLNEWLRSTSPAVADSLMGGVIARTTSSRSDISYQNAADLALEFHSTAANDDLLFAFLDTPESLANRDSASRLAQRIRNGSRRRVILEKLSEPLPSK